MTPCILHDRALDRDGYGIQWFQDKKQQAHRVAWIKAKGPIPPGMDVLHRCDVRACRNLEHLFLGTKGDNNRDRAAKGRSARGPGNGAAKLNASKVEDIRRRLSRGESMCSIGRVYGVDFKTVRDIRDGLTWKHVGGEAP